MDRERALQWCERLTQAGYPALPVEHHDGDIVTWKVAVEARVSTWASRDNVRLEVRADFWTALTDDEAKLEQLMELGPPKTDLIWLVERQAT